MNSAMMPAEGYYTLTRISAQEFAEAVKAANAARTLRSYIGYPQNAQIIQRMTGVRVAVTRDKSVVRDGDTMLIMRLNYRVAEVARKGEPVDEGDFEFFRAEYGALRPGG